jgi:hypothetical protein
MLNPKQERKLLDSSLPPSLQDFWGAINEIIKNPA